MNFAVEIPDTVTRFLERQRNQTLRRRIIKAPRSLESNPRPQGCVKLKGSQFYRVRVGDYRIIYDIKDDLLIVLVVSIGHRREIYR